MVASFFLDHVYYWGDYHYESVLGPERAERISPARSALKHGVSFTLHQDSPVAPPDVMGAVHNAVNRKTEKGRVLGIGKRLPVFRFRHVRAPGQFDWGDIALPKYAVIGKVPCQGI